MEKQINQRQLALGALDKFFATPQGQRNLRRRILWERFCDFFGDSVLLEHVSIEDEFAEYYKAAQRSRVRIARIRRKPTALKRNKYVNKMRA